MTTLISAEGLLQDAVKAGVAPGFVTAAATADGRVLEAAAGVRGTDNPTPMGPDTVFWLASLTKAVTTVAALQLVEQGALDLDAPVGPRLPGLAAPLVLTGFDAAGQPTKRPAQQPITLRHLLSHTSGLGYDFCSDTLATYFAATGQSLFGTAEPDIPLLFEPGEAWQYGVGCDWAARLIEQASGEAFADYVAAHITGPLGMGDTTFFPNAEQAARKASVHARTPDGGVTAIAFGMPPEPSFMMGGGGLYGTARDYLTFLRAILAGGRPILGEAACALMTANQTGALAVGTLKSAAPATSHDFDPLAGFGRGWGLGFLINEEPMPGRRSAGSLAWAGLANCYYWADPTRGVAGVFLSQVLPFADPKILQVFEGFERAVYSG